MTDEICPYCDDGLADAGPEFGIVRCRECAGTGVVQPIEEYPDPRDDEDWKRHAE